MSFQKLFLKLEEHLRRLAMLLEIQFNIASLHTKVKTFAYNDLFMLPKSVRK